jgi:hypothetical protein
MRNRILLLAWGLIFRAESSAAPVTLKPVLRPNTAEAIGLRIPRNVLLCSDEVIE